MKILVAGVGGIGGWLAGTLARGGASVSLYARGQTLAYLQSDGLKVIQGEKEEVFKLPVWDGRKPIEDPDVVLLCSKAQGLFSLAEAIKPSLESRPRVSAVVNGLPWWFLDGLNASFSDPHLETIDPGRKLRSLLADCAPIGSVVHGSSHAIAPGVIRVNNIDRFIVGDLDGKTSEETQALSRFCEDGGVSSPVVDNIRTEVWAKLWGNMSVNPPSALTNLSTAPLHDIPETRALIVALMEEFEAIGQKVGLRLPMSVEERIEVTLFLGDFRPSMLVDRDANRRLEVAAMMGCVVELADRLKMKIPASRTVYALIKGLDHSMAAK